MHSSRRVRTEHEAEELERIFDCALEENSYSDFVRVLGMTPAEMTRYDDSLVESCKAIGKSFLQICSFLNAMTLRCEKATDFWSFPKRLKFFTELWIGVPTDRQKTKMTRRLKRSWSTNERNRVR